MNREALLTAALPVFFCYSYRKTTMDDLAKEVGTSRQSLYNAFGNKEKLFREMVRHLASEGQRRFAEVLVGDGRPLGERLVEAFDVWTGRHMDALQGSRRTQEISQELCVAVGEKHLDMRNGILAALTAALRREKMGTKKEVEAIALTLYASSKGLTRLCDGRASYLRGMRKVMGATLQREKRGAGR